MLPGFNEIETLDMAYPERIRVMWLMYGHKMGERCKSCKFLHAKHYAGTYLKCRLNNNTNGPATDWRANWPACGKWEAREAVQ